MTHVTRDPAGTTAIDQDTGVLPRQHGRHGVDAHFAHAVRVGRGPAGLAERVRLDGEQVIGREVVDGVEPQVRREQLGPQLVRVGRELLGRHGRDVDDARARVRGHVAVLQEDLAHGPRAAVVGVHGPRRVRQARLVVQVDARVVDQDVDGARLRGRFHRAAQEVEDRAAVGNVQSRVVDLVVVRGRDVQRRALSRRRVDDQWVGVLGRCERCGDGGADASVRPREDCDELASHVWMRLLWRERRVILECLTEKCRVYRTPSSSRIRSI